MKSPRKAICVTAIAGALALVVSGCSTSGTGGTEGEVDGSTIVLQTLSQLQPQFEQYAEAYMKEFPDRTVEVRSTTDKADEYAQRLATGRISGDLPDVFFNVDTLANMLADNKVTLDLAPGIEEGRLGDLGLDDFLPQFVGQYRPLNAPEQVTGLPVSADSVALFYNKTLFQKYGVDLPTAEWTWDDVYAAGEKIQSASDGAIVGVTAPAGDGSAQITFGPMIKAFGGYLYDPETQTTGIGEAEALKAWEYMLSFYGTASPQYSSAPDQTVDFAAGNVAMTIGSRAGVPNTKLTLTDADWDVEVLPTVNGESTTGGGSYGLSIAQTSSNQAAAWEFLAWFYDTDAGMKIAQEVGGVIPPTEDGIDNGIWKDSTPPPANLAIFGDSARTAVLLAQMPGGTGSVLTEATKRATQQVMLEGRDLSEAFQEAQETVQAAIDREVSE